ncbi:hypothetical protein FHP25_20910 [Vineibacter terrae]|uniref:Uncharacterized protein n=1 Tax=Vineibacter terrae TaxID=2586908 RepID=A0A5C8PJ35_9HYPH|nr:hypothetical protein [Vineibacter terrae]TXL73399.1 hypothetical protein FHP25_20910 [Vineibacter terrae]
MARDVILVPRGGSPTTDAAVRRNPAPSNRNELAREWADQYVAAIPDVRGSADVGGSSSWQGLASALTTRIISDLAPSATLCFLGGPQMSCTPVPGVSLVTRTVALCSPNITLDPEIVFYNTRAASGPQQGKSLREVDDDAIARGSAGPAQLRRDKRKAYDDIGAALAGKILAVELLPIEAVVEMSIARQLCADWRVMVGGYKKPLALDRIDGRTRLFFQGDAPDNFQSRTPGTGRPGFLGSNSTKAETDVPPFDQSSAFLLRLDPNGTVTQIVG